MARGAWSKNHGNKIAHRWWLGAWWHAADLRRRSGEHLDTYACFWRDDGNPNGRRHWHVGHTTGVRKPGAAMPAPAPPGRKGMASVRVWLTQAEYKRLQQLSGEMHPSEYAARIILAEVRDPSLLGSMLRKTSANSARTWN